MISHRCFSLFIFISPVSPQAPQSVPDRRPHQSLLPEALLLRRPCIPVQEGLPEFLHLAPERPPPLPQPADSSRPLSFSPRRLRLYAPGGSGFLPRFFATH